MYTSIYTQNICRERWIDIDIDTDRYRYRYDYVKYVFQYLLEHKEDVRNDQKPSLGDVQLLESLSRY